MGNGFSIAWRVLDAQFWGVPQHRRRIALVADFGGHTASEILFVRKGVPGDSAESGTARESAAGDAADCVGITNRGRSTGGVSETLRACSHGALPTVIYDADGVYPAVARTLMGRYDSSACVDRGQNVVRQQHCVRRLTPLECERLQGFPDGWTDIGEWVDSKGKKRQTTDSARYKALGNSIALPPWKWVLKRLCAQYERDATMASLFDGIGGFPLIWERINGTGTCLWTSEIEEFTIAVTKYHFGED